MAMLFLFAEEKGREIGLLESRYTYVHIYKS